MLAPGAEPARAQVAILLDLEAVRLYRLLLPFSARLAAGVLSAVLSAAEHLREGAMIEEGDDAVDINLVIDASLRRPVGVIYLQAHRKDPALLMDSSHLPRGLLRSLLDALHEAERAEEDEAQAILRALPVDVEAWLQDAARAALGSARPDEVQLWRGREPLQVAAELLVVALRRLLRELNAEPAAR